MKYLNIYCKDTEELVESYNNYLKTNHWNNLKILMKQLTDNHCTKCNNKLDKSYLIHANYKNLGNENINDLMLLCENCFSDLPKINYKIGKNKTKNCRNCKYSKIMLIIHRKSKNTKELYCNLHCKNAIELCKDYKKRLP